LLESADIVTLCSPAVAHQSCRPGGPRLKNRHDARVGGRADRGRELLRVPVRRCPHPDPPPRAGEGWEGAGEGRGKASCKSGKTGRIIESARAFDPVILDKAMYIRYLLTLPEADEQGAVFADQGARIGLSGG
jgi:hypothetical protein